MGRRGYPPEFRRKVLDLVEAGRSSTWRGISGSVRSRSTRGAARTGSTRGLQPGLTSTEKAELTAANRRISELETELAIHRRASELLGKVVPPKGSTKRSR